jgi:hypothetical protein
LRPSNNPVGRLVPCLQRSDRESGFRKGSKFPEECRFRRWTDDIVRRDPLRDQYVILFFSAEGKFTRMFSNIADIPPIFPRSEASWHRLMWGEPKLKK